MKWRRGHPVPGSCSGSGARWLPAHRRVTPPNGLWQFQTTADHLEHRQAGALRGSNAARRVRFFITTNLELCPDENDESDRLATGQWKKVGSDLPTLPTPTCSNGPGHSLRAIVVSPAPGLSQIYP